MPRFKVTASLLFAAILAAPAFASNGFTPSHSDSGGSYHAMPGGKSRDEVKAELAAAIKDGSLAKMNSEAGYAPELEARKPSSLTRADVLAELKRARDDGSLARMSHNYSYTLEDSTVAGNSLSRAQVLSDLRQARDDGSLKCLNSNNARNC